MVVVGRFHLLIEFDKYDNSIHMVNVLSFPKFHTIPILTYYNIMTIMIIIIGDCVHNKQH